MATIKQVAERARVSQATVSRVMNGSARVSQATRERVDKAMEDLGYTPNAFAQSLASNRSNSVGLVVSELSGPYYGQLMTGLENTLRSANKHLLIASGHGDESCERDAVEFLLSRRCDALVLHTERLSDQYLIELAARVPAVFINRHVAALPDQSISLNNEAGGFQATQHLISLGHRRIACITGPMWKPDAAARLEGYRRALQGIGIAYDEQMVVEGSFSETGGREAIERLLGRKRSFTALVAGDDDIAIGALTGLRARGHRVPEDIALVGFDDAPYARYVSPPLSSVYLPIGEMATMAGKQVLKRVYHKPAELRNRFEPELVVRASSGQGI
ncbi:MAG: LacI family DNA-binding transcriptional regulator [Natronospirillum sp.]